MVCPEMVRCYTLLKREFSTCRRRGPRSAGPDEQTLQQRNLQALTHPCWPVDAPGTRRRPAYISRSNRCDKITKIYADRVDKIMHAELLMER